MIKKLLTAFLALTLIKKVYAGVALLGVLTLGATGLVIDYMEYATDGAAQSAYVTSATTTDLFDENGTHTITAVGNAAITTAQYSSYNSSNSSVYSDGSGDYLTILDSADWAFGTGDFTIDWWMKPTGWSDTRQMLLSWGTAGDDRGILWVDTTGVPSFYASDGTATGDLNNGSCTLTDDTWQHFALIRSGTTFYFAKDGTLYTIGTSKSSAMPDSTSLFYIGSTAPGTATSYDNAEGYWDNYRITKGTALWTSNFSMADADLLYTGGGQNLGNLFITGTMLLQSYSESTISEGTYSLGLEATTDALNETVTKTLTGGDILDLTGKNTIKFDIECDAAGSAIIQAQITDVGITNSTHNVTISSADTVEAKEWDISGISAANKDAINKLIWKILNSDSARNYKIDNVRAE